jgi:hypothetical protein
MKMNSLVLLILILICVGVWLLVFSNSDRKIIEAIKEIRFKLDDIQERLPEVDYEARDEEALRTEKGRWHEEEKELIKQLPEAVSAAQKYGFIVELGSRHYSVEDGNWGETHVPVCRVKRGESCRYFWPVDFVTYALKDSLAESEAMRSGTYPYNQAGQAQLEKLFALGITKN